MRKSLLILVLFVLSACTKTGSDDLFCHVTLRVSPVQEETVVALNIDNTLAGNFFQNLNTGEKYNYPMFVNGKCEMTVLKGVYVLSFDGTAAFADGTGRRVRCTEHNSPNTAVQLLEDQCELTLELLVLQ